MFQAKGAKPFRLVLGQNASESAADLTIVTEWSTHSRSDFGAHFRLDIATFGVLLVLFPLPKELLDPLHDLGDRFVDRLVDLRLHFRDEVADLLADASQADEAGEEADEDGDHAGEGLLDPVDGAA